MKPLGLIFSILLLTIFISDADGQLFRRRSSSFSGGCSTSYCYPPSVIQQVQYVRPNIVPYVVPAVTSSYDDLDVAFSRISLEQQRHRYFLEKLQVLGLNRNYSNNIYGQVQQQQSYGQVGVNGNTIYGTTVQSLYNFVGPYVDTGALYLQSAQLTRDASTLHGNALNGHQSLVAAANSNQARLLEILSRGEAAARVLNALEMPKTTISNTTSTWGSTSNGGQQLPPAFPPPQMQPPQNQNTRVAARFQLCGSCHNDAGRKEAGLNINDFDSFNASQKSIIMGRLITSDLNKRMPRNPDGSVGQQLSPDLLDLFK